MKTKELKKKTSAELIKELGEKQILLRDIRFGAASGKSKNVKEYANTKKDIAKMRTLIKSMH